MQNEDSNPRAKKAT